jgi:hypothetical protein
LEFGIVPIRLKALSEEPDQIDDKILELTRELIEERDEYQALEAAILDLTRLDRYERRAWSRQNRAIREFVRIKLMLTRTPLHNGFVAGAEGGTTRNQTQGRKVSADEYKNVIHSLRAVWQNKATV